MSVAVFIQHAAPTGASLLINKLSIHLNLNYLWINRMNNFSKSCIFPGSDNNKIREKLVKNITIGLFQFGSVFVELRSIFINKVMHQKL
jgi:hypothetical protein